MKLPGTDIPVTSCDAGEIDKCLDILFMAGGLSLSQLTSLGHIENYDVQNWIKRGFCSPCVGKKYTKRQFCRLVTINILKDSLQISDITSLISYINGVLDKEEDDLIPDDLLYCLFASAVLTDSEEMPDVPEISALQDEDRERIRDVIKIMIFAYRSSLLKKEAEESLRFLGLKN